MECVCEELSAIASTTCAVRNVALGNVWVWDGSQTQLVLGCSESLLLAWTEVELGGHGGNLGGGKGCILVLLFNHSIYPWNCLNEHSSFTFGARFWKCGHTTTQQ